MYEDGLILDLLNVISKQLHFYQDFLVKKFLYAKSFIKNTNYLFCNYYIYVVINTLHNFVISIALSHFCAHVRTIICLL